MKARITSLIILAGFLVCQPPSRGVEIEPLAAKDLERIWSDLTHNDDAGTRRAFQGIQQMIGAPGLAVPFLKERLKQAATPDNKRIEQAIADLDSGNFGTREQATKELEALGILALPALEKKLREKDLPLEMSNRLKRLLQNLEERDLSADELRGVRAIEVLQGIGSAEAKAILEELARGPAGSRLTIDARRALHILGRRNAK